MYRNLIEKYGSPLYVYDKNVLEDCCLALSLFQNKIEKSINKKVKMHYSTKSNSNPAILKVVKDYGLAVDCMSPFELEIDMRCGFQPEDILYVCNNIDENEMIYAHSNVLLICFDSISQVEQFGKLYAGSEIMVRINPGTTGVGHSEKVVTAGSDTKFGITEQNIPELLKVVDKYNLKLVGVHQHLGSLFLNEKIPDYIAGVKAGLQIIKNNFKNVKIIDLGGGFGVPYKPDEEPLDFDLLSAELIPVLNEFIEEYPSVREFKFEPGRFVPCEAGELVGKVTAVKYENGKFWIGTDIGMNQLVRPSMYDSYHKIRILSTGEKIVANICGNVCESGDILGRDRTVNKPKVGDIVIVSCAGAYGYSMASNYTGRPRPAEIMISNNKTTMIRKRETIEDLMKTIFW